MKTLSMLTATFLASATIGAAVIATAAVSNEMMGYCSLTCDNTITIEPTKFNIKLSDANIPVLIIDAIRTNRDGTTKKFQIEFDQQDRTALVSGLSTQSEQAQFKSTLNSDDVTLIFKN